MKCPLCGGTFKDPTKVKGGQVSKRKLTKKQAREMVAAREAKRKKEKKLNKRG